MKRIKIITTIAALSMFTVSSFAQNNNPPQAPTGIKIVPKVQKPKNTPAFDDKKLSGYLLVYFKDQNQSAYLAISKDGYTFTDYYGSPGGCCTVTGPIYRKIGGVKYNLL